MRRDASQRFGPVQGNRPSLSVAHEAAWRRWAHAKRVRCCTILRTIILSCTLEALDRFIAPSRKATMAGWSRARARSRAVHPVPDCKWTSALASTSALQTSREPCRAAIIKGVSPFEPGPFDAFTSAPSSIASRRACTSRFTTASCIFTSHTARSLPPRTPSVAFPPTSKRTAYLRRSATRRSRW